jgi:hypothetical protein
METSISMRRSGEYITKARAVKKLPGGEVNPSDATDRFPHFDFYSISISTVAAQSNSKNWPIAKCFTFLVRKSHEVRLQ